MIIISEILSALKQESTGAIIQHWMKERGFLKEDGTPDLEKYICTTCRFTNGGPLTISDNPSPEELKRCLESQITFGQKADLYVDITGGTRVASIVSLIISRWYEQKNNASIGKVLYSSIMNREGIIIDWTENYKLFGLANPSTRITEFFEGEELLSPNEYREINALINDAKESGTNNAERIMRLQDFEELLSQKNTMESLELRVRIQKAIRQLQASAFEKLRESSKGLSEGDRGRFIKDFYESIEGILINAEVLDLDRSKKGILAGSKVNDAVMTVRTYYYGNEKNKQNSVLGRIQRQILRLQNDNRIEPKQAWTEFQQVDNAKLYQFINKKEYTLKGANGFLNKAFIDDLKENKIKCSPSLPPVDQWSISDYENWRNVYYNAGFPFACIDGKNSVYDDVRRYYLRKCAELFKELQDLREKDPNKYQEQLNYYDDDENLAFRIPQMVFFEALIVNEKKLGGKDSSEAFFEEYMSLHSNARMFRNAEAHPDESRLTEYRKFESVNDMVERIKEWLDKYEALLSV